MGIDNLYQVSRENAADPRSPPEVLKKLLDQEPDDGNSDARKKCNARAQLVTPSTVVSIAH